ncbi:TonB-dependent receptor plug domain-containing protein [Longimicrobium sp.]|uniref:TonB-dependent receptor plug domain-containing protein n=1 Tax=Longimicrobium sp. TaxID=2029185 RepID=UPI002C7042A6|nr:TonB-dependent receptor plug domain-containing protein [Longimicrobium sp.]HSU15818.1 TonB-dependent receptor plug domain-containing protein [Longimicrobium sp.]
MSVLRACAAALVFGFTACASNATPRRAPTVLASAPARVAPPPVIVSPLTELLATRVQGFVLPPGSTGVYIRSRPVGPAPPGPSPLYFVDGKPVPGNDIAAMNIRPEQVEAIEVIKGMDAVGRYGAAAEHGVVLITLKHDER